MAGMDVTIINTMTDDYNKQNAVAVGLATGTSGIELPNLADPSYVNGWIQVHAGDVITNATTPAREGSVDPTYYSFSPAPNGSWNIVAQKDFFYYRDSVLPTQIYMTTDPNARPGLATDKNIKIDASDGLSPGELYAVGRSASNTETKDQALTITPQKMDSVLKSIERDAKA